MTLKNKMFIYLFHEFSLDECSFLTNILQWALTKQDGEPFYKTDKEMMGECRITEWELRVSKEKFEKLGFFKTEKRNPMKFKTATPYIVNYKQFLELKNKDVIKKIQQKIQTVGLENPQVRTRESSPLDSRIPHIHITEALLTTNITTYTPLPPSGDLLASDFSNEKKEKQKPVKDDRFEEAWVSYGKIGTKKQAESAYRKAIKAIKHEELIKRINAYRSIYEEKEKAFKNGDKSCWQPAHKHFSTWLNQQCFDDEALKLFKPPDKPLTEQEKMDKLIQKVLNGEV